MEAVFRLLENRVGVEFEDLLADSVAPSRFNMVLLLGLAGCAVLLAVALQSITDYPLRNQSLLAFAALALLLLVRFGQSSRETRS